MVFGSIFREIKEGRGKTARGVGDRRQLQRRGRSHIAPEGFPSSSSSTPIQHSPWANLPPELLLDIIQRLESIQTSWPARKDVVACASVCRSWRSITKDVVRTPEKCGLLTFPISLKQPGPRDSQIQCFIKRERASSTYRLYFGLSPALSGDVSKLLLAARKIRRATSTEFAISLVADDFSRTSDAYIGKSRSNFLGTKFTIYDSQPPCNPAKQSNGSLHQKTHLKRALATVSYELNVLRTRGPRRMCCTLHSIPLSAIQEGGAAPTPTGFSSCFDEQSSSSRVSKENNPLVKKISSTQESIHGTREPLILKNKTPRWHEQLQCWCLNFKGRVTVASVKNFQLVAAVEPSSQTIPVAEQEKVMLQFGKIGKDIFTMDYRYPLSAFQAFAICLSSIDTKPACE